MLHSQVEGPSVLIIDDDRVFCRTLQYILQKERNFTVARCESAEAGIDHALSIQPDLIFCDLILPKRSGFAVVNTLKSHPDTRHIPIILITGSRRPTSERKALAMGAEFFLAKPLRYDLLMRTVDQALNTWATPVARSTTVA